MSPSTATYQVRVPWYPVPVPRTLTVDAMRHATLALLVHVPVAPCVHAGYDMRQFAHKGVKEDTGFEVATIQYIWDKYHNWNGSPAAEKENKYTVQ